MASPVIASQSPYVLPYQQGAVNPATGGPFTPGEMPNPYLQSGSAQGAGTALRNRALLSVLQQLQGPSLENLYAAPQMDELARQLQEGRQGRLEALTGRGLAQSGAATTTERGLSDIYSSGVINARNAASQAETGRQQNLLTALINIGQQDATFMQQLAGGALAEQGATNASIVDKLNQDLMLAHGSAIIASILAGGIAGGAGAAGQGSALSTAAGGQTGVLGGMVGTANIGQQLGSGGGGAPSFPSFPTNIPSTGGTPVTGGYSPYGPYPGAYSFPTSAGAPSYFAALQAGGIQ